MKILTPAINRLVDDWINEDIGRGDLTNFAINNQKSSAYWIAKQSGIFCGGTLVDQIFKRLDVSVETNLLIKDGEAFQANQKLLEIKGPGNILLAGERTALNLSMRLSGIATATAILVAQLKGTGVMLADTRKTTPGLRILEKYAFRCGGGVNHRLGLDDAAMLKENHLYLAGGVKEAVKLIRESAPWPSKIIVEVEEPNEAKEAVLAGADGILLDEFPIISLKDLIPKLRELATDPSSNRKTNQIILEASGVDTSRLIDYAKTGIDLISCSAPMTKSSWIDFSMLFKH